MNLEVTLAGTVAARGIYTENGTYNSAAAYELAGGAFWIWWHDGLEYWILSADKGDPFEMEEYYYSVGVTPLSSDHAWSVGTLGDSPAPTVTEYSGGGGGSGAVVRNTGWMSPSTVGVVVSSLPWTNEGNTKAQDDAYGTSEYENTDSGGQGGYAGLQFTGFSGLSVIEEADTILGVEWSVDNWGEKSPGEGWVRVSSYMLYYDSDVLGDSASVAIGDVGSSDTDTYQTYGADDWMGGEALTPAMMDSTFGVQVQWHVVAPGAVAPATTFAKLYVDHVRLRVWYLDADGGGLGLQAQTFMGVL
jgi:hypothetical protein